MDNRKRFPPEVRERAVRLVFDQVSEYGSQKGWAYENCKCGFDHEAKLSPACTVRLRFPIFAKKLTKDRGPAVGR